MKIVLIYPNFLCREAYPPMGIAYLGSYLKRRGYSVSLLDATFYVGYQRLADEFRKVSPDVVGISFTSPLESFAYRCATISKELFPKIPVIAGGPHASIFPESTLGNSFFDIVVAGEGELAFEQVLKGIRQKEDITSIPGVWVKNRVNKNFQEPPIVIDDLDYIPFPKWDMFENLSSYIKYNKNTFPIMSGRGCPFRCSFCQPTIDRIFGHRLRRRSPENVIEEIVALKRKGVKSFVFTDDTFTISQKWTGRFCELMIANKINMQWSCNSRVDTLKEESLVEMKRAGLFKIAFGVESGSDRILNEVLSKGFLVDKIKEAFALCHKHKILANAFLMMGSPGETLVDIAKTVELVKEIKPNWIACTRTVLLPKTYLWDYALEKDLLSVKYKEAFRFHYSDFSSQTHRLELSTATLRKLRNRLYLQWALVTFNKGTFHKIVLTFFASLGLISPRLARFLGARLGKVVWVPPAICS
jgi:anaerobic magnesium-protoporphyrin IX monomethyl ester cyclase